MLPIKLCFAGMVILCLSCQASFDKGATGSHVSGGIVTDSGDGSLPIGEDDTPSNPGYGNVSTRSSTDSCGMKSNDTRGLESEDGLITCKQDGASWVVNGFTKGWVCAGGSTSFSFKGVLGTLYMCGGGNEPFKQICSYGCIKNTPGTPGNDNCCDPSKDDCGAENVVHSIESRQAFIDLNACLGKP